MISQKQTVTVSILDDGTLTIAGIAIPVPSSPTVPALVEVSSFALPSGTVQVASGNPISVQPGDYLIAGMMSHGKSEDPASLSLSDSQGNVYSQVYSAQTTLGALVANAASVSAAGDLTLNAANNDNYMATGVASWLVRGVQPKLLADKIVAGHVAASWDRPAIPNINLPAGTFAIVMFSITSSGPFGVDPSGIPWTLDAAGIQTLTAGSKQNYWAAGSFYTTDDIVNGTLKMTIGGGMPVYDYVIVPFALSGGMDWSDTIYDPELPAQTPTAPSSGGGSTTTSPPPPPPQTPSTLADVPSVVVDGMSILCHYPMDEALAAEVDHTEIPGTFGGSPIVVEKIAWNFGDGTNGFGADGRHPYAKPGTYTITGSVWMKDGTIIPFGPLTAQIAASV